MGTGDLLKPAIERHLNGTIHFGRVSMKPGKPTTFATAPTTGRPLENTPLIQSKSRDARCVELRAQSTC